MVNFKYIDFIKAMQNNETIDLIGDIDVDMLKIQKVESLYYSIPLIEKMILEIYKMLPESDVEDYKHGVMRTINSIIQNNKDILSEKAINIINEIYGEEGFRNNLFHVNSDIQKIVVNFENINYLIIELLCTMKYNIKKYSNYEFKEIEYL